MIHASSICTSWKNTQRRQNYYSKHNLKLQWLHHGCRGQFYLIFTIFVDGFEVLHFYNGSAKMMEIWLDCMWQMEGRWVRHSFLDTTSGYQEKQTVQSPFFCVFMLFVVLWPFLTLQQSTSVLKHDSFKVTMLVSHHLMTDFQAKLFSLWDFAIWSRVWGPEKWKCKVTIT